MTLRERNRFPLYVERLLQSLGADERFANDVLGDLADEYSMRLAETGETAARWWYYGEAIRTAPHLLRDWRRRLRLSDGGELLMAFAWATLAGYPTAALFGGIAATATQLVTGTPMNEYLADAMRAGQIEPLLAFGLVIAVSAAGLVSGYVAALVSRRAPLSASLVTAGVYCALSIPSIFMAPSVTSLWMLATLTRAIVIPLACVCGGAVRVATVRPTRALSL